jgi:Kef-type K+ transport system membrane component KefB
MVAGRTFEAHLDEDDRHRESRFAWLGIRFPTWFPTWVPPRGALTWASNAAGAAAVTALAVAGAVHLAGVLTGFGGLSEGDVALTGRILLAVVVIVAASRAGGRVAEALRQPRVIGEMAVGFLLGPSLFGALAPEAQRWLFPPQVLPHLQDLAQLAVVCFVFLFGADLSLRFLRGSGRHVVAVALGMVVIPVTAGVLFAFWLAGDYRPPGIGLTPFVLFVGVAMGVTAFPVLVRILQETGLARSRVGFVALTAAGLADGLAWCLLAVAVGTASGDGLTGPAGIVTLLLLFAVATWTVVRPALRRFVELAERRKVPGVLVAAALLLFALGGAYVTDQIGVHAIFGAFFVGLALPRHSRRVRRLTRPIERGVRLVLPLFFAAVGLSIGLGFLESADQLAVLGLIVLVAVTGKLGGTALVARLAGMRWRESVGVGVMVNCRGLTELVVLTTGLSLGIIGNDLFVMFVLMTLLTTAATGPLLGLLHLDPDSDGADAAPATGAAASAASGPAERPADAGDRGGDEDPSGDRDAGPEDHLRVVRIP